MYKENMCVCMHVCQYMCIQICTYCAIRFWNISVYEYVPLHEHVNVCMYGMYVCLSVCMYVCM